ncbi:DUF418 domain-containing protein [Streptomyces sp. NPDC007861]|uniref:DUF418 domain-containing protein n=1 Tax=Streptomyces sp. NPDC007861 TaxID=3154893 RepID=UPI0033C867FC
MGIAAVQLVVLAAHPVVTALLHGELGTLGDAGAEPGFHAYASGEEDALAALVTRLTTGLYVTFAAAPLSLVGGGHLILLLGFWAARRRVLEEPGRHLRLLRRTAAIGITVGWLGGLPAALAHIGALDVPADAQSEEGALTVLRDVTGNAAGIGYVAAVALFVHWWTNRSHAPGRWGVRGRRSRPSAAPEPAPTRVRQELTPPHQVVRYGRDSAPGIAAPCRRNTAGRGSATPPLRPDRGVQVTVPVGPRDRSRTNCAS